MATRLPEKIATPKVLVSPSLCMIRSSIEWHYGPDQQDIHLKQFYNFRFERDSFSKRVYIPQSGCAAGYKAPIAHLLHLQHAIIMGDFNAHYFLPFKLG